VTEEIGSSYGIAVDWIYDLLYWTDSRYDHIQDFDRTWYIRSL
jgi:hypothetical protein